MRKSVLSVSLLFLASCGQSPSPSLQTGPVPPAGSDAWVVHARATLPISASTGGGGALRATDQNVPVTVTVAASTTMTVDSSKFVVPAISNTMLSFGTLTVSGLSDNNLTVCGTAGTTQCGNAVLRIYTTGTAGAGLWNATGAYGLPITSSLTTPLTVGLAVANAAVMQTFAIPATTHVMHLSNFAPTPTYTIQIDFSNAGTGSYSTTLVVEYALTT